MPASYSYKVRVLAALDAHYNPSKPTSIRSIDSKYESDCNSKRLFLPPTWRKRVKNTLDKLVAEDWLTERNSSYIPTPQLHTIIADEKLRLNVNQRNHEWRVFASVVKRMEIAHDSNNGDAAPPSTPATRNRNSFSAAVTLSSPVVTPLRSRAGNSLEGVVRAPVLASSSAHAARTRNRTCLNVPVRQSSPTPTEDVINVRKETAGSRIVRYSDPGPLLSYAGSPTPTPTTTRNQRSLATSSQAPAGSACSALVTYSRRRCSIAASRTDRRHTLSVASTRHLFTFPEPVEPVSREIQFFPLKQTLSARTRRALRRNALSEEMNDIDAEKRAGQKKNRELLEKLRAELAESTERLKELERELAVARFAPFVEPEELAPINEQEEQADNDYDLGYAQADSPESYDAVTPARRSPSSVELQTDTIEAGQTSSSNRDQRIRDLEAMIEALRQDIAQRAEEERLRAQEDEVFHDAEEQIMHEDNNALAERIEELTALKATDTGEHPGHATFCSSGVDSGIGASSNMTLEIDIQNEKIADLKVENDRLHGTVSTLSGKIREVEKDLEASRPCLAEREKTQDTMKKEIEKLRGLEKELEKKVSDLEEMEGERLMNVGHMMVQTDKMVDEEKMEMEKEMELLTEQIVELQKTIKVVTEEIRDAQANIAIADAQIEALLSVVKVGEVAKLQAETQIRALTMQIAELEDAVSEKKRVIEYTAKATHARIANLEVVAESGEAAKIRAEAQILTLTNQIVALEVMAAKERQEAEIRLAGLKVAAQSGEVAKSEAQIQITRLTEQIRDIETSASKASGETEAQIADMQAIIESTEVAQSEAQAQVRNLERVLKTEKMEAEFRTASANAHIAELIAAAESNLAAIEDAESQICLLRGEISGLEVDTSTFEEKNEMQEEIDILNRQVESLGGGLEELREENVGLGQEVKDWEEKGKGFEEAVENLRQDKASLEKNMENLEKKVEGLENVAADLANANAGLETDYTNLSSQLVSQQQATKLAEKTSAQFQQDLAALRSHINASMAAAEISRNENDSLEQELASLQEKVSFLESARKLSGNENQDLQIKIDGLCSQIENFKQDIEGADQEKNQLENSILGLRTQVEVLKRTGKVVEQQNESLQQIIDSLTAQLAQLTEELDTARTKNDLSMQDIENYKSEIGRHSRLLDIAKRDQDDLRHVILELEKKMVVLEGALRGSNETNRGLEHVTKVLQAEITTLKKASEIADEERSIIQQKIRPYIQCEESLDMAVEEMLTELVMANNRADENERLRTELSNKIRILAQDDENNDSELINPVDIVEKLIDRFKEVRECVEKLYLLRERSRGSPFKGHNLRGFSWTGSNEVALTKLGLLVGDLDEKITFAQARAEKLKEDYEKEKEQARLYSSYLEDIAMAVGTEGQVPSEKAQTLDLVTLRLSNLRQQIETAKAKVDELNEAVTRKDNIIRDMEMDIDSAVQRETYLNKKVVDTISAHNARLGRAQTKIEELEAATEEKADMERELHERIEQQTISNSISVKELEQRRDEAISDVQKLFDDMREAKAKVEHLFGQSRQENELAVLTLRDALATSQAELSETCKELEARKISHQQTVELLEGGLAQSRGEVVEVSRKLREQAEKNSRNILALEVKLRSSSEEVKRQVPALKRAEAQRDTVINQLNSETESNQNAITGLECKVRAILTDAEVQQENDRQTIASLKVELQTTRDTAEGEKKLLQMNIHSRTKKISHLTGRIKEVEKWLEEAEHSEKELDERLKVTESQSQLFNEEANKVQESLMVQKREIQQELMELKQKSDIAQEKMQGDITALKALVDGKLKRIQELDNVVSILRDEKSKLQEAVNELDEEGARLEAELELEQRKSAEVVQNITNENTKYMARFGDVKTQFTRECKLRQAERSKQRRKRVREEQVDEDRVHSCMPPTPAPSVDTESNVIVGLKKRERKRRRYDSGIGFNEGDEEFEDVSVVGD